MTWLRIDDGWVNHPKVRRAGKDGRSLWVITATLCAGAGTDGLVDPMLIKESYAPLSGVSAAKARVLVDEALWHDSTTIDGCPTCASYVASLGDRHGVRDGVLERGWFVFHDWAEYQPPSGAKDDPVAKLAEKRRRQLRKSTPGKELQEKVRLRDRDQCRYCGRQVTFGTQDRKSPSVGTFDHVDPFDFTSGFGGNSQTNVVVACHQCNGRKGQRTPAQWVDDDGDDAYSLRPAPTKSTTNQRNIKDISETDHGFDHGQDPETSRQNPEIPRVHARLGSGPDRDQVDSLVRS